MTRADDALAADVAARLGPRHPVFLAVVLDREGARTAVHGAALDVDVEIGSISKGVTGLLYADALERGEVTPASTLEQHLPELAGSPAGAVTLSSLAVHRSGIASLPRLAHPVRRTLALLRRGTNPYGDTLDELLVQVREEKVGSPRPRYSNTGFELLGHAVARAAGTSYPELVDDRIAGPLGLDGAYVPASAAELRPGALTGATRRGRPREPWTGEGLGPAGGLRATATDLARLLVALRDGTAPGMAALDPVESFQGSRIGAGWLTTAFPGRTLTWHNGGTGGFRSWLGIDRSAGVGAAIVTATAMSVDRVGVDLVPRPQG